MAKKKKRKIIIKKNKYEKKPYSYSDNSKIYYDNFLLDLLDGNINKYFQKKIDSGKNNLFIKKRNLYCRKCDSNNIYPVSQIIVNNEEKNNYEYKKYWFVLRKVSDLLKKKILFMNIAYNKTKSDFINSIWIYLYFVTILPILTFILFSFYFNPNISELLIMIEFWTITFIFFIIVLINYLTVRSYRKKYYNTYCCMRCGCLFIPQNYKVRLKKNTSLFVKLHLAYNKLTRKKFYNVRYVTYQVEQEMKKLGMR